MKLGGGVEGRGSWDGRVAAGKGFEGINVDWVEGPVEERREGRKDGEAATTTTLRLMQALLHILRWVAVDGWKEKGRAMCDAQARCKMVV